MATQATSTPPKVIDTGAKPSVNQQAVKKTEQVPAAASTEVIQPKTTEPPPAVNRGAAPAAPASKAVAIAQRQEVAKPAPVAAVQGSRTETLMRNLAKATTTNTAPEELVADILVDVPKAYCYPITRICEYIRRMDPRKAENRETGAIEQAALYNAITNIINNQEAHFTPLFTALLRMFNTYNGPRDVFHDFNSSRFLEIVNLNAEDRKAFNNLVCLLKTFAEPKTRDQMRRITDHSRLLAYGLTDSGRNRVMSYLEL